MQRLHRPAALDKAPGQEIEELRVSWRLTHPSEIVRRSNQAFAKMPIPDAVHKNTGRQRMIWPGEPVGKIEPSAAFLNRRLTFAGQDQREALGRVFAGKI